jgi:hypothetical protein
LPPRQSWDGGTEVSMRRTRAQIHGNDSMAQWLNDSMTEFPNPRLEYRRRESVGLFRSAKVLFGSRHPRIPHSALPTPHSPRHRLPEMLLMIFNKRVRVGALEVVGITSEQQ